MSIRVGAILIFAAFLTSHIGYELSESSAAQAVQASSSEKIQQTPQLVSRTVVIARGQSDYGGRIELSYGVVLLTSSILLLYGLILVWPSPRYEAT
jgi:hypothetical protein